MILERDAEQGVAWLRLNRPDERNALDYALLQALDTALLDAEADPAIHVVVISAAGPVFCAGHDLREMQAHPAREEVQALFAMCSQVMQRIVTLRQPVIACVQGVATAAGCQLVASCDLAVASRSARFATPGVAIGLFCSTPLVALGRSIGRKAAMEMALTGDMIDAEQARAIGLINRVVPDEELDARCWILARGIAERSPLAVSIGKATFYRQIEMPLAAAYEHAGEAMADNMMTKDAAEGIAAFLEKRAAHWTGT